ncbi:MAG: hypothetical protein RML72_09740 [Bacteroidia bacterium]|nr:hypothetical protein [Bacteroidia bacterium]MDW8159137.1 hypothetical protein [Bacteroidia bacterium]
MGVFNFIVWFYQMQTISNMDELEVALAELWSIWFTFSVIVSIGIAYIMAISVPYKQDNSDVRIRRFFFIGWGLATTALHYVANHFHHRPKLIDDALLSDWDSYNWISTLSLLLLYFTIGVLLSILLKKYGNKFGTII